MEGLSTNPTELQESLVPSKKPLPTIVNYALDVCRQHDASPMESYRWSIITQPLPPWRLLYKRMKTSGLSTRMVYVTKAQALGALSSP